MLTILLTTGNNNMNNEIFVITQLYQETFNRWLCFIFDSKALNFLMLKQERVRKYFCKNKFITKYLNKSSSNKKKCVQNDKTIS